MERIKVVSSVLSSAGYDRNTRILEVELREKGIIKQYFNVDEYTFQHLISCTSIGLFYLNYIDGFYAEKKVE